MPIINDPFFHWRLWRAARGLGWYRGPSGSRYNPGGFYLHPEKLPGLEECSVIDAPHTYVEELIKHETACYFAEESPAWLLEPGAVAVEPPPLPPIVAAPVPEPAEEPAFATFTPAAELAVFSQVSLFDLV